MRLFKTIFKIATLAFIGTIVAPVVYKKVKKEQKNIKKATKHVAEKVTKVAKNAEKEVKKAVKDLSKRQGEIYRVIEELKETGMKPLEDMFKNVSTRTLRRDLNTLVKKGHIKRSGSTNNTKYKLVK